MGTVINFAKARAASEAIESSRHGSLDRARRDRVRQDCEIVIYPGVRVEQGLSVTDANRAAPTAGDRATQAAGPIFD